LLDTYTRRARVAPAVIACLPAMLLVGVSIIDLNTAGSAVGVIVGTCGIVVSSLVRGEGLRIQPDLWRSWGGPPTTQRLRWNGNDSEVVARRHRHIEVVTGGALPSITEENEDPDRADRRYANSVEVLREKTRGPQFAPLASENAEYGFRRNCLGIRRFAVGLALVVAVASIGLILLDGSGRFWADAGVAFASAFSWWRFVTLGWVRSAAERYADRLLEAAAGLSAE
jgi:hypothetical protein